MRKNRLSLAPLLALAILISLILLMLTSCGKNKEEVRGLVKEGAFKKQESNRIVLSVSHLLGPLKHDAAMADLEYEDIAYNNQAIQKALLNAGTAESVSWENDKTEARGRVTIVKQYINKKRQLCKEYMQFIEVKGSQRELLGHACRQNDGMWKVS